MLTVLVDWRFMLLLLGVGVVLMLLPSMYVQVITMQQRFRVVEMIPEMPVAMVLGAGVWEDGSPTPMLAGRIQGGVDLYKQGRVKKLLMTGDNSREGYNEVGAMFQYALVQGVPAEDMMLDHAGLSTYESCYRAKTLFGVTQMVVVTQRYHLPRAIYTCRGLGIQAVGLGTPDWGIFQNDTMFFCSLREFLSVIKALIAVHITHPLPRFVDSFKGMN
jgi:vancomycin permeability regulator SanA